MLFSSSIWLMIGEGIIDTLYMVLFSTAFAYIFGLPIAIALVVTRKDGLRPMPMVNMIIDTVVNILRSVPFLILMILVTPLMRLIAGKGYGIHRNTFVRQSGYPCLERRLHILKRRKRPVLSSVPVPSAFTIYAVEVT